MIRRAFLLGLYSVVGQVLLLRELVASLNGDELFISTALFGWLISVAVGAYLGGRSRSAPHSLFWRGAVLLPVMIVLVRFSPMLTNHMAGEVIPFTQAVLISVVAMFPVGLISGWLFPSIARQQMEVQQSIIKVYLFEGLGAFLGGIVVAFAIGPWFSSLQLSFVVGLVIAFFEWILSVPLWNFRLRRLLLMVLVIAVCVVGTSYLEPVSEGLRFKPFRVEKSFDTHYGRQVILSQADELVLLTDNTVEAVYPSTEQAENALIPALVYHPGAKKVAYIGRAEFGVAQLADSIGGLSLIAIDPRRELSKIIDGYIAPSRNLVRYHAHVGSIYLPLVSDIEFFDIVIIDAGFFETYKSSRFITPSFLGNLALAPRGLAVISTSYDSDRYIGAEEGQVLSVIRNVLKGRYGYTEAWPGTGTIFFASDSSRFTLTYDSIVGRIDALDYTAQFVSGDYLSDRLDDLKKERLIAACGQSDAVNNIDKPILPYLQALFRSKMNSIDHVVITQILTQPLWLLIFPAVVVVVFLVSVIPKREKGRYALFLFFTAGVVSLSLELVSFYVFQSYEGSLYWALTIPA